MDFDMLFIHSLFPFSLFISQLYDLRCMTVIESGICLGWVKVKNFPTLNRWKWLMLLIPNGVDDCWKFSFLSNSMFYVDVLLWSETNSHPKTIQYLVLIININPSGCFLNRILNRAVTQSLNTTYSRSSFFFFHQLITNTLITAVMWNIWYEYVFICITSVV